MACILVYGAVLVRLIVMTWMCRYIHQGSQGRTPVTKEVEKFVIPLDIGSGGTAIGTGINIRGCRECILQHNLKTLWENCRYYIYR
jgi:fumarate hydratase class II